MLLDRWIALYQSAGIWEQYNSLDATPYGVEGLGMSTLIVDWLTRRARFDPSVLPACSAPTDD
jgi:hypothetical protein